MSWSFAVPATPVADFETAAATAKTAYVQGLQGSDYALDQVGSGQVDAAIAAAAAVVASGVVGTGTVTASFTGHANPGHAPVAGYANEVVAISIACADRYVAPEAPAPTS